QNKDMDRVVMEQNDALRPCDFLKCGMIEEFRSFVALHQDDPAATRPQVEFMDHIGEPVWPPPLRQFLRIGKGVEQGCGIDTEQAIVEDFCFVSHACVPFPAAQSVVRSPSDGIAVRSASVSSYLPSKTRTMLLAMD